MLRKATALLLLAACARMQRTIGQQANNPETLAERSQARARTVLDRAVEANGGAEALRAIEVVRLRLEGETFPRLQMTTPAPPFEGGSFRRRCCSTSKNNRLRLEQKASGFGFDGDNTVTIAVGTGNELRQSREDGHADPGRAGDPAAVHPVPPAAAEPAAAPGARPHELAALPRRRPVRRHAARGRDLRHARHAAGRALCRRRDAAWCRSTS